MSKVEICLNCPLLFCDDRNPDCGLRPTRIRRERNIKRERTIKPPQDRTAYYRAYYQANRARKIEAASARQKAHPNTKDRKEYWREYKRKRKHEKANTN